VERADRVDGHSVALYELSRHPYWYYRCFLGVGRTMTKRDHRSVVSPRGQERPQIRPLEQTFACRAGLIERAMKRFSCIVAILLTSWACGGDAPTAPPDLLQPPDAAAEFATVSGWVYARALGDPPLADALVELREADGSARVVRTDRLGFYKLTVRPGDVSIAASKESYETKAWEFSLLKDTVLNFGLTPK
jgi:hypothetical protein